MLRAQTGVETHLILSRAGERTAWLELERTAAEFKKLADFWYPVEDIGGRVASGSALFDGMVIAPCSINTMSSIAAGIASNLLVRAADVALKERRKLILMVRETPFHLGHLRNMAALAEMGAIIAPPVPAFYSKPETVDDIVNQSLHRVLDLIGLPAPDARRWEGSRAEPRDKLNP
jgi:4-hydroxy-3-polyprenylbenzoate decarboxylase